MSETLQLHTCVAMDDMVESLAGEGGGGEMERVSEIGGKGKGGEKGGESEGWRE